ncbi:hypothetical protein GDO78_021717 [Eleutherodactylus coqui]|uniref:Uncharacterized protein n=1 Tax=Eleutherodactylus coqui TaxID=57060 RepID=A0A8J6C549_ELECQ|nr:hypothetical protein GDO78_021717 [Eleutherodactylus coqui]
MLNASHPYVKYILAYRPYSCERSLMRDHTLWESAALNLLLAAQVTALPSLSVTQSCPTVVTHNGLTVPQRHPESSHGGDT